MVFWVTLTYEITIYLQKETQQFKNLIKIIQSLFRENKYACSNFGHVALIPR